MQFKIGKRRSGKTQDLLNEFLDDGLTTSVFVCFSSDEAERIRTMVKHSAEASKLFPKGFKNTSTELILAKLKLVVSYADLITTNSRGKRDYLYIDNLDMVLRILVGSMGYEIKTATITE